MATKSNETYTINSAAAKLGLSTVYVRRAILKGALKTVKEPIAPESKIMRHNITASALEDWRTHLKSGKHRADGRSRFTLYATSEELTKINELLDANKVAAPIAKAVNYNTKAAKAARASKKPAAVKA